MKSTYNTSRQDAVGINKKSNDHISQSTKRLNYKKAKYSYRLKQRRTELWTYFCYFVFLGLVLTALYLNRKIKTDENVVVPPALALPSSIVQRAFPQFVTYDTLKKKRHVRTIFHAMTSLHQSQAVLEHSKKLKSQDTIKTEIPQASQPNNAVLVRKISIQQTELRIPCYADNEDLKLCQDKLLQSGIRLDMKGIVYGTKDKRGVIRNSHIITYCNADLYISDSLFKSVELNNFKEFRIKWDSYSTGEVNIKSISMLDHHNILKHF